MPIPVMLSLAVALYVMSFEINFEKNLFQCSYGIGGFRQIVMRSHYLSIILSGGHVIGGFCNYTRNARPNTDLAKFAHNRNAFFASCSMYCL
jgi:hypothetical protein